MTTRAEAIADAAEVYGAILADPESAERLRRHREQRAAKTSPPVDPMRPVGRSQP